MRVPPKAHVHVREGKYFIPSWWDCFGEKLGCLVLFEVCHWDSVLRFQKDGPIV